MERRGKKETKKEKEKEREKIELQSIADENAKQYKHSRKQFDSFSQHQTYICLMTQLSHSQGKIIKWKMKILVYRKLLREYLEQLLFTNAQLWKQHKRPELVNI